MCVGVGKESKQKTNTNVRNVQNTKYKIRREKRTFSIACKIQSLLLLSLPMIYDQRHDIGSCNFVSNVLYTYIYISDRKRLLNLWMPRGSRIDVDMTNSYIKKYNKQHRFFSLCATSLAIVSKIIRWPFLNCLFNHINFESNSHGFSFFFFFS